MSRKKERIATRRKKILEILAKNLNDGKTYGQVASETGCSIATVRTDLETLMAKGKVRCDDSRVPFK